MSNESEIESPPSEDAAEIAEMTTKDLDYYKAMAGFERTDSQFWKKFYCGHNAVKQHCMLQTNHLWKEEAINLANLIVLLL